MWGPREEGFNSYTVATGGVTGVAAKSAEAAVANSLAAHEFDLAVEKVKSGPGRLYVLSGQIADQAPASAIARAREDITDPATEGKFIRDVKDAAFRMATGASVSTPEVDVVDNFAQASAFGDQRPFFLGTLISDAKTEAQATAEPIAIPLQDRADFIESMLDPERKQAPQNNLFSGIELTVRALIGNERRSQLERQLEVPQGRLIAA